MSHYFIDKHDPRVADLFRRLEKAGKALDKLESSVKKFSEVKKRKLRCRYGYDGR